MAREQNRAPRGAVAPECIHTFIISAAFSRRTGACSHLRAVAVRFASCSNSVGWADPFHGALASPTITSYNASSALSSAYRQAGTGTSWHFVPFLYPCRFPASHGRFEARAERAPRFISPKCRPDSPNIHVGRRCKFGRNQTRGRINAIAACNPGRWQNSAYAACMVLTDAWTDAFVLEPLGLPVFRRHSNFLSAAQSSSTNILELDNFQLKFSTRNTGMRSFGTERCPCAVPRVHRSASSMD
jgi:hypothetical protein